MFKPENLIRKGLPKGYFSDMLVRGILRSITYLIVLVAVALFAKIIIDGAPAILTTKFPFVDTAFLTSKNETLHVFDDAQGIRHQLPASKYNEYLATHPGAPIANEQTFSYSGGGIAGPIAGTALLTVGSIILALFFGVSAAIYLAEYARQSPFIHAVRLATIEFGTDRVEVDEP